MRKREMTKKQLAARAMFVDGLEKAGWSGTGVNEMFDDGDFVSEEAQLEYDGKHMRLLAEFSAEKSAVLLYLEAPGGKQASFVIQWGDDLSSLLKLIASFQDKISPKNFKRFVGDIVHVCPQTFADTPKGLQQLVED